MEINNQKSWKLPGTCFDLTMTKPVWKQGQLREKQPRNGDSPCDTISDLDPGGPKDKMA